MRLLLGDEWQRRPPPPRSKENGARLWGVRSAHLSLNSLAELDSCLWRLPGGSAEVWGCAAVPAEEGNTKG